MFLMFNDFLELVVIDKIVISEILLVMYHLSKILPNHNYIEEPLLCDLACVTYSVAPRKNTPRTPMVQSWNPRV